MDAINRLALVEHDGDSHNGYAVFTGINGETENFCAFFVHEKDAEAFVAAPDPEEPESKAAFDPCIVIAVLTPRGIVASNDFGIETHDQLRTVFARFLEDEADR